MKKYLLSMLALVLAIGFSAFNSKPKTEKVETPLYWYHVDVNGDITGEVLDDNLYTKSYIDDFVGCPDGSGDDCARGYLTEQPINEPAEPATEEDAHIMRDNP